MYGDLMADSLVSLVIPITRYEKELHEALDSVFSQTYKNFEIILVDNHATEGSRIIAEDWQAKNPDRIRVIREEIKGACSARNRGIQESHGEFIAFLDSDDRMLRDRLMLQHQKISSDKSLVLVGSWFNEISPDGKNLISKDNKPQIPRWWSILFKNNRFYQSRPFYEPQTSTFFFRASVAREIGMFDKRLDPFWLEDTDFVFRMFQAGNVEIIPRSLVEYRTHTFEDNLRRIFDIDLIKNHDVFFNILKEKFNHRVGGVPKKNFLLLKSRWLRESGVKLLYYKNGEVLGKELIRKSFRLNPLDPKNLETVVRISLPKAFYPRPFGVSPHMELPLPEYATLEWAQGLFSFD